MGVAAIVCPPTMSHYFSYLTNLSTRAATRGWFGRSIRSYIMAASSCINGMFVSGVYRRSFTYNTTSPSESLASYIVLTFGALVCGSAFYLYAITMIFAKTAILLEWSPSSFPLFSSRRSSNQAYPQRIYSFPIGRTVCFTGDPVLL